MKEMIIDCEKDTIFDYIYYGGVLIGVIRKEMKNENN